MASSVQAKASALSADHEAVPAARSPVAPTAVASGTATLTVGGATSSSGNPIVGIHELTYAGGLASTLGYQFLDAAGGKRLDNIEHTVRHEGQAEKPWMGLPGQANQAKRKSRILVQNDPAVVLLSEVALGKRTRRNGYDREQDGEAYLECLRLERQSDAYHDPEQGSGRAGCDGAQSQAESGRNENGDFSDRTTAR